MVGEEGLRKVMCLDRHNEPDAGATEEDRSCPGQQWAEGQTVTWGVVRSEHWKERHVTSSRGREGPDHHRLPICASYRLDQQKGTPRR